MGDNPPHAKAKARYIEIDLVEQFVCTMEWPETDEPQPVVFVLDEDGLTLRPASATSVESARTDSRLALVALAAAALGGLAGGYLASRQRSTPTTTGPTRIREAIKQTRGTTAAPGGVTGFGRR